MKDFQPKPKLHINLDSPDGNIHFILSKAACLMRKWYITDQKQNIEEMRVRATSSQGYREALSIIGEYVDLELEGEL